jgi:hypothetical protein
MEVDTSTQKTFDTWQSRVLQTIQNLYTASINVAKNMIGKMTFATGNHANTDLGTRDVSASTATPTDNSDDPKQKKIILEVISEICNIVDGISTILSVQGFKNIVNAIDFLSNLTQYAVSIVKQKHGPRVMSFFYDTENKDIIFKRLISVTLAMSEIILKLTPQLTSLKSLSKALPWVNFLLEIIELFLKREKFIEGGMTKENMFKIAAALSYHIVLCATFALAGQCIFMLYSSNLLIGSGTIIMLYLLDLLISASNWLISKGMGPLMKFPQSFDKLVLENSLANNIHTQLAPCSTRSAGCEFFNGIKAQHSTMVGLNLCCSSIAKIMKLIKNNQETSTNQVTESTVPNQTDVKNDN